MEPQELTSPADVNRRTESWFHLPAEEDRSQFLGLEFQDSRLSPALALLPEYDFSGYSLFQQTTDLEFAPLRGSPDVSVASERFLTPRPKKGSNGVVQPSDPHRASLSQHPLAYTSTLSEHPLGHTSTLSQSEEMASSCCSLSEHSMSPGDRLGQPEEDRYPVTGRDNEGQKTHRSGTRTSLLDPDRPVAVLPDDSASFLSGDIPARKLLELLQKDVGMPSGSSSAVSSVSEISLNRINLFGGESRSDSCVSKPDGLREERDVSQRVQPDVSPELQPDVSPELQPDVSPELQPDVSPELQPDVSPELQPDVSPELQPDVSPELQPDVSPELQPDVSPELQPDVSPELQPDVSPELQPDVSPELQPDVSPELQPDVSPPVTGRREGPQGGASVSPENTEKLKSKPSSRMSEISNITIRSLSSQPDESSNALRRQLCSELEKSLDSEPGAETLGGASRGPITSLHSEVNTPYIVTNRPNVSTTGSTKGRLSVTRGLLASVLGQGAGVGAQFSAGFSVERGHRERDLWSSGNQTGIEPDVSFLSLLPQPVSQSTPGVFLHAPVRSSTKMSPLTFNMEVSQRSSDSRVSPQPQPAVVTLPDRHILVQDPPLPARETVQEPSGRSHHSLPSLNYLQKVDAWKTNQSSNKMSFYDNLSLQGFSGVSPKQKAYDAVSDSLTRMLTLPQLGNQTLSRCESGPSSPTRGEAAGSGLPEREDTPPGPVGGPSPLGRSQSHSSLNTVVTSIQRAHRAQTHTDQDSSQTEEESAPGQPRELEKNQGVSDRVQSGGGPKQPSHFISLSRFSNVSSNRDVLSSSQDSGHSGQNFEVSVRAASSSVVSLEVDNYAPYWSSKPSSPHKERELNIEERIPMYLHNLGIDQSPSTILNPFGPRGPIREPEFSPTDLCTIKGSTATGTPTKSTQPSEGDSPHKGEFSRSSLLSVASSMSLPLSVDSLHLHPIRSQEENTRGCMSPSPGPDRDRSPSQGSLRMALCPLDISVESTELQDSQQDSHCLQPSSPAPQSTQPLDLHIYQLPAPQSNHQKYPGLLPDLQSSEQHQRDSEVNVSTQAAIEMAGRLESSADSLSQYRDRVKNSLSQYKDGDRDSLYRDMDRDVLSQYRDGAVASCPQVNTTMDRSNPDDSFVGSQTLQDIRLLLGRAENIVSGGSTSSGASSRLLHSDDDILLLSLRRKMKGFQDSSFTSSSGGAGVGDLRSHSSLLWARSSSDSMLPADRKRDVERESSAYSGEGHVRLTREAEHLSTPAREESGRLLQDREHYGRPPQDSSEDQEHYGRPPQDSSEDREHYGRPPQDISGSSSTFLLTESVRRAEPEGCSAGLSDTRIGPVLLSVMPVSQPGPSLGDAGVGKLQQAPTTTVGGGNTVQVAPAEANSSSSSFSCPVGSEQGFGGLSEPARGGDQGGDALSDGGGSSSGGSSLAARVARLLQSESPATVVSLSSRASTATSDLEESRAREWLRLKVSGQQCETLELNTVDRQRIEEIKREILFNHPLKSQRSMDTDSSSASSLVGPGGQPPSLPQPEEQLDGEQQQFRALRAAEDCLSHQLQQLTGNPFEDSVELRTPLRQDLEARVRQIALREGIYVLPRTHPPPLTSITIATSRRSPLSEPLQVSQFTLEGVSQPTVQGWLPQTQPQQQERESNATSTHRSVSRDSTTTTGSQANSSSLYPRDRKTHLGQEPGQERGQEPGQEPGQERGQEPGQEPGQLPGRDQENHFTGPPHSAAPLPLTPGMYGQMSRSHPDVGPPGSIVGSGADWVSGAWTSRTGHVSHLHLTLSPGPKGAEERSRRLLSFAPVRHSSAVSSSVDVDESPSYAPEPSPANQTGSQENRDPIWRQGRETADASVQITTGTSTATSTFPQCFTPPQRLTGTGPSRQAALSVLLPYKPHGSEMFYVSQTHPDPQLSPVRSDSIGESTHPGSDDAVPPRFNIEILGSREQQVDQVVDRGVNIKHTEGIYSKRLRLGENYSMERTGTTVPLDEGQPMIDQHAPQSKFFSHVTGGLTRGPAIPTTTTRGPAVPSTTTRGPAIPSTTTRGPAIPSTTTRGPAIPTTTTRGPAIPSTTTRGPAIPSTTTRGPAIPTTTTRGPSGATRDHGTSITTSTHTQGVPDTDRPVQPSLRCSLGVGEEELEVFQPLHVEMDYSSMDLHHHFPKTHPTHHLRMDHQISNTHLVRTSAPHPGMEREPGRRDHSLARRSGSTLDQLWRRFSERWSLEEARPTNEREASLLERLERLSRLIHSTGTSALPEPEPRQQTDTTEQDGGGRRRERKSSRKEEERRREGVEEERSRREKSNSGRSDPDAKANQAKASVPRRAWEQQDEEPQPAEGEDCSASYSSSPSHRPARSQYLCPAERESSGSISGETSSSMSTIDTARLVRAFGAHRVRGLNTGGTSSSHRTSHSLSKLYSTILQQRQSKEQRRGRSRETPHIPPVPSESTGTDDSVIPADSASSTSTLPSHRGPSHSKKAVKHVSKGVQAGDLEIVSNGTRRHTRDVGTTFPSPGSARGARVLPSSHSGSKRVRAGDRSPPKTQRKRKMSQPFAKPYYPQGVSWYIPAEDLRAEGRKENNPEQQPTRGPAWFEPYSRTTRPWREPLRQRQIQDRERLTDRLQTNQLEADRDRPNERQHIKHSIITPPGPEPTGNTPAALVRISLQEALELRRPEFVSRSRERVKRLLLQVEERKLQVVFSRERNELFNQPRRPGRLAQPAGTAVFQRAVPKKELVQRSKQMYEQLPEVQRRREEEKRREEYRSYRLNAQLYNKRITNRVLGRQTPWQ